MINNNNNNNNIDLLNSVPKEQQLGNIRGDQRLRIIEIVA
jgi:hypothetical protein